MSQTDDPNALFGQQAGSQHISTWSRDEVDQLLSQVDDLQEDISSEDSEEIRQQLHQLKRENAKLRGKLDAFKQSPPLSAWVTILLGIVISFIGYILVQDIIYMFGGVGISLIGAASIYETFAKGRVA